MKVLIQHLLAIVKRDLVWFVVFGPQLANDTLHRIWMHQRPCMGLSCALQADWSHVHQLTGPRPEHRIMQMSSTVFLNQIVARDLFVALTWDATLTLGYRPVLAAPALASAPALVSLLQPEELVASAQGVALLSGHPRTLAHPYRQIPAVAQSCQGFRHPAHRFGSCSSIGWCGVFSSTKHPMKCLDTVT